MATSSPLPSPPLRMISTSRIMGCAPLLIPIWNGFIFLNLSEAPGPLAPDMGLNALDNWPMDSLLTGHRHERLLNCNWKVFWENYNECLHCPGIHPELCDMVPIYGKGIMSAPEAADWTPDQPTGPNLKPGAQSWTMTGAACGPDLPRPDRAAASGRLHLRHALPLHLYRRPCRLRPLGPAGTPRPRTDAADRRMAFRPRNPRATRF